MGYFAKHLVQHCAIRGKLIMIARRTIILGIPALTLLRAAPLVAAACRTKGSYSKMPLFAWDDDGRTMELSGSFSYTDRCGKKWRVPKGAVVDGASIPQLFWTPIGSPFTGLYRNASVIHDWYCAVRTEPWKEVHMMFYDGMLTSGVSTGMAAWLYYAVRAFGPSWDDMTIANNRLATRNGSLRPEPAAPPPPPEPAPYAAPPSGPRPREVITSIPMPPELIEEQDRKIVEWDAADEAYRRYIAEQKEAQEWAKKKKEEAIKSARIKEQMQSDFSRVASLQTSQVIDIARVEADADMSRARVRAIDPEESWIINYHQ